jgi:hypothetical protein
MEIGDSSVYHPKRRFVRAIWILGAVVCGIALWASKRVDVNNPTLDNSDSVIRQQECSLPLVKQAESSVVVSRQIERSAVANHDNSTNSWQKNVAQIEERVASPHADVASFERKSDLKKEPERSPLDDAAATSRPTPKASTDDICGEPLPDDGGPLEPIPSIRIATGHRPQ